MRFKTMRLTTIRNEPKWTISASGGFWAVTNSIRARHWAVCQQGCWAPRGVDCKIPRRLEKGTKHSL